MKLRSTWTRLASIGLALILLSVLTAVSASAAGHQDGTRVCTGNNLTIKSGETVKDVLAFGCNVTIELNATVQGDVSAFGANIRNQGTIQGSIVAFGGNVTIESEGVVRGSVNAIGGNVLTQPGAIIQGSLGRTRLDPGLILPAPPLPPGAPVPPPAPPFGLRRDYVFGFDALGALVSALAFAVLGALVVIFAPEQTRRVSNAVQARPLGTAGVGCLTLIVLPTLGLLLAITLVGVPVALLLAIVSVLAWFFGWIAIGYFAGEKILRALRARDVLPVLAVAVGVALISLLGSIPVLGFLFSCLIGVFGLGAVVLTRFGTRAYPTAPPMMAAAFAGAGAGGGYTQAVVDTNAQPSSMTASAPSEPAPPATPPPTTES